MKVKSVGGRARPSKAALPKPSSIPRSVSLLTRKDDCGGGDNNYSSEIENIEAHNEGVNVTPASGDIFGGDGMEIDSLEEETCMKCNGGGLVLLCCETGCPVALHEKCVGSEPLFDDTGKFYCPYCLYKRALARTHELREKAMEAKKELSSFLEPKVVGGDNGEGKGKEANADRPDTSVLHGNKNHHDLANIPDNDVDENQFRQGTEPRQSGGEENVDNIDQNGGVDSHEKHPSPHATHDSDNVCDGQEKPIRGIDSLQDNLGREKVCEDETFGVNQFEVLEADDSREHERGPCERVIEDKQQGEPSSACYTNEETNVDGSLHTSTTQAQDNAKVSEEIHKEQMQPQTQENIVSSTRVGPERRAKQKIQNTRQPHNVVSPSKLATQLKDALKGNGQSKKESLITSKEPRYYAEKSVKGRMEKDTNSRQQQESAMQDQGFCGGKRKRMLWTAEEEEMLKKGVDIISSNINKNIPWRKILDFGRHVFDPSRNPSDLKDKWKTLSKDTN